MWNVSYCTYFVYIELFPNNNIIISIIHQVEIDFRALFADVIDNLCMTWTPSYANQVLTYANLQVKGKWQSYLNVNVPPSSKSDCAGASNGTGG